MEFSIAFTNNFKHSQVASKTVQHFALGLHWRALLIPITSCHRATSILYKKKSVGFFSSEHEHIQLLYPYLSVVCLDRELAPIRVVPTEMHLSTQDTENPWQNTAQNAGDTNLSPSSV